MVLKQNRLMIIGLRIHFLAFPRSSSKCWVHDLTRTVSFSSLNWPLISKTCLVTTEDALRQQTQMKWNDNFNIFLANLFFVFRLAIVSYMCFSHTCKSSLEMWRWSKWRNLCDGLTWPRCPHCPRPRRASRRRSEDRCVQPPSQPPEPALALTPWETAVLRTMASCSMNTSCVSGAVSGTLFMAHWSQNFPSGTNSCQLRQNIIVDRAHVWKSKDLALNSCSAPN